MTDALRSLEEYASRVEEVRADLQAMETLAVQAGDEPLAARIRANVERTQAGSFQVAVAGEWSTGKSTLINALVGRSILPTAAKECTMVLTRLRGAAPGRTTQARVRYSTGATAEVALTDLRSLLGRNRAPLDSTSPEVVEAEIEIEATPWLAKGVELVDTPGVNATGLQGDRITLEYLPRADAIVFLTRADRLLRESEVKFLKEQVISEDRARLFVVVNAADRIQSEKDRLGLQDRCQRILESVVPQDHVVLLSAQDACEALEDGDEAAFGASGIPAFRSVLERFLLEERAELQLEFFTRMRDRFRRDLETGLQQQVSALRLDAGLRAQRIDRIRQLKALATADEKQILADSDRAFGALQERVQAWIEASSRELERHIESRNRSGGDVDEDAVKRLVDSEGRAALGRMQGKLRGEIDSIHGNIAGGLSAVFDRIDGEFSAPQSVAIEPLDFGTLVQVRTVDVKASENRPDRESSEGAAFTERQRAGLGLSAAVLGAVVLGPAWALLGPLLWFMTEDVKPGGLLEEAKRFVSRRQADARQIGKSFRDMLTGATRRAVDEIRSRTTADIQGVIRSKMEELDQREREAMRGAEAGAEDRAVALERVLTTLGAPRLQASTGSAGPGSVA